MTPKARWSDVFGVLGILAILGAVFFPVQTGTHGAKASSCLANLKQAAFGLIVYASDHDERLPPSPLWMDRAEPYAKATIRCPSLAAGASGYAFNAALSSAPMAKGTEKVPLAYDSTNLSRNAADYVASLPIPGRHQNSTGRRLNAVGYADGHAKMVSTP